MAEQRPDWKKHQQEYSTKYAPNGVSIAEYSAIHGLNKNTARRYLRAGDQSSDQQGDHQRDHAGDHAGDHLGSKKGDHQKKTAKASAGAASDGDRGNGSAGAAKGARRKKNKNAENDDHSVVGFVTPAQERPKRPPVLVPRTVFERVRTTGAKPDNDNAITHAGYSVAPDEVWDSALAIPAEEITEWNLRGAVVSLINIARRRDAVQQLYEKSLQSDTPPDEDSAAPPPEVQLLKTVCSGVDLEVMLRGFIQRQQQQDIQNQFKQEEIRLKQEEREHKRLIHQQTCDILKRMDQEGLTATYACRLIECIGGTVPATLLREFEHELKNRAPETDDNASYEAFESEVANYRAQQEATGKALERRRAAVMELAAEMGCGDAPEDNASMLSVSFTEDDDDGEEWEDEDEAATYADRGIDSDIDSERDDEQAEEDEEQDFFN